MAKKSFADTMAAYKRYDPKTEGYGSVADWSKAFKERMGIDEAKATIGADSPLMVLGFTIMPSLDILNRTYQKLMMKHHPDRGGSPEMAMKIIAAYTILEEKLNPR